MHYTIKVYQKDGSILYTLNTTDPYQARRHYYGAAKKNKEAKPRYIWTMSVWERGNNPRSFLLLFYS